MKERYLLPNRYGDKNYLVRDNDNGFYRIELQTPELGLQISLNENGSIYSIDPSGGPFMYVGYEVEKGVKVDAIVNSDKGFRIKLIQ